jgi:hypothetical protein
MYGFSWTSLTLLAFLAQATLGAQFFQADAPEAGDATEYVQADSGLHSQTPLAPTARSLTCRRVLVYRLHIPTALAAGESLHSMQATAGSERLFCSSRRILTLQLLSIRLQV